MRLSRRITSIHEGGPDGWELHRRASAMVRAGEPVIQLTIGEHDVPTDAAILDEMRASAARGRTGYAEIAGLAPLRAAIAERCTRTTGHPTRPEEVIVTGGGQMALFAAFMATCDPGDRALYVDPYYPTYPGTIRSAGAVPVAVEARAEDGFEPRAEAVDAQAEGARALLINSPHNPTGVIYGRRTLEALAEVVTARDMWLVSDEVYDAHVWEGAHLSPRSLPGMAGRTLVVGSLSKSHAMTGSRIGWLCGPVEAMRAVEDLALNTSYGLPGFIQDAGLFALSGGAEAEARIAEPFRRRRGIVRRLVGGQQVVGAAPMRGAMYAMLDIRATGLSGAAFAERLLEEERIAVMPGESFGRAGAGHVRLALTVADERLEEAVARLLTLAGALARAPA